jgi:Carboxypeptidase regulatory-like domain
MAPGCGNSHPTSPLAPSTAIPPVQPQQQSVAGYVGDTAFRSVTDARVEVLDGPQAGMAFTSDANGHFSFTPTSAGAITLRASKDGYIALTKTTQTSIAGGRPWVYFQLELLAAPVNLAGDYTLTFVADSTCVGVPNELRTRAYAATIAPQSNPSTRPDTAFTVTASGVPFLEAYNNFTIGVAGDYAAFMVYQGEGFGLVEQVAPNTFLGFYGEGKLSVGTPPPSTISVAFDGAIDYCVMQSGAGGFDACTSGQAVEHQQCKSKNHRLILTRR